MTRRFAGRSQFFLIVVAALVAILTGLWVNLLSSRMTSPVGLGVVDAVRVLGWSNVLIALAAALVYFQYRVTRAAARRLGVSADALVENVLAAASRSLTFPHLHKHIRAVVTLRDGATGTRVTRYSYNTSPDPERVAAFPLDFGVTGEAYTTRSVVLRELQPDHVDHYDESVRPLILPALRCVLAAPLLKSNDLADEPIGVLAFDSELPPSKLFFDKPGAREIAQRWADIVAEILSAKEGYRGHQPTW